MTTGTPDRATRWPHTRAAALSLLLVIAGWMPALAAQAQARAWLDRDRIGIGETTTLNIETDQATVASPDYAPLAADFIVTGHTSNRRLERSNGRNTVRVLFAVALRPRRDGILPIPSLRVGAAATQPLALSVTPAAAPSARARGGGAAFIEAQADDRQPYVQQAVGYVVRLYYAAPLLSGQLDQPPPDGAALQRVGQDMQYQREVGGRLYTVVERRFLLIPERSGTLVVPAATFAGRAVGGFFDELFGDGQRQLSASGAPQPLRVRAVPDGASQPWLPLRGLALRYLATPGPARAGEASTVTIEATADGATAAQLAELQLSAGRGAQVFAEPAQVDETFDTGRPQVRVTRSFAIVPGQAGPLRITGPRLDWWDVRAGVQRTASLPDLNLEVAPGEAGTAAAAAGQVAPGTGADGGVRVPGAQGRVDPWALAAVAFAVLWLATLAWALQHRRPAARAPALDHAASSPPAHRADLARALDTGDLGDVARVLCAMADPPVADLDQLRPRLDDAGQVAAVDALQRARWGGGDGTAARGALRAAFRSGPRWRAPPRVDAAVLPPLYPP